MSNDKHQPNFSETIFYENNIWFVFYNNVSLITASSGNFLYWKTEFWKKKSQMHVNLEWSAQKDKSARASNFGKCKPSINPLATSNVVYPFECECDSVYIRETPICLRDRIWQHRYHDSHIGKHIIKWIPYKAALHKTYNKPGGPNVPDKGFFKVISKS